MKAKLTSRKLWVAIGAVISLLIAEFTGVSVSPEAIAGIAFLVGTYILGQGLVDKDVMSEQVKVAGDTGRLQMELYARNLEQQLEQIIGEPAEPESGLSVVPE
jgi:uncharacterized membrane protein